MDWKLFFEDCKEYKADIKGNDGFCSDIESLYLAFKARLLEEEKLEKDNL